MSRFRGLGLRGLALRGSCLELGRLVSLVVIKVIVIVVLFLSLLCSYQVGTGKSDSCSACIIRAVWLNKPNP